MMWDQLLKRHSVGRPQHDRDIETPTIVVKTARKPRKIGPRTADPALPFGVTANQARGLDAIIQHGDVVAAADALGIHRQSLTDSVYLACKKIPGPHRLAKLIQWANARGLHKDAAEC
jgi:hypothetical protein